MNFNTHQETDKSNKVPHFRPDCPRHNNKVGSEPNNNSGEKVEVQKNNVSQGNHYVTNAPAPDAPVNVFEVKHQPS